MDQVLIADDDPLLRMVLRAALEQRGFAVEEAHDGDELVRLLASRRFTLCVMDARMPGPPLGNRIDHIRETAPGLPVVVLTGLTDVPDSARPPVLRVLTKPIDLAALDSLLGDAGLAHPAPAGAAR